MCDNIFTLALKEEAFLQASSALGLFCRVEILDRARGKMKGTIIIMFTTARR